MFQRQLAKFFEFGSYILVLLSVFAVPLLVDNRLINSHIIPKQYVFGGLVILAALFWAARLVATKKISYRQSMIDKPIGLFLLALLLSAIFSLNRGDSFLGVSNYFSLSVAGFALFALFYMIVFNHVATVKRWRALLDTIVLVGGISAALFLVKVIFNYDLLAQFGITAWNLIDPTNSSFGIWLIMIFMLSAGQLIKRNLPVGRSLFNFFIVILTLGCLLALGFEILWWILLIALAMLMLLGITFLREARMGWLTVLFAIFVTNIIFIVFGSPRILQSRVPAEIALGPSPSWSITAQTATQSVKNFLLGSGLGTFGADFSRYRNPEFNNDAVAWSLRFNQPHNTLFGFLAEGGLTVSVAFLFLVLFFLGHVLYVWLGQRAEIMFDNFSANLGWQKDDARFEIFLVALVWFLLTICGGFAFFGQTLWWLWWMFLGLGVSGLSFVYSKACRIWEWEIEDAPQYSLSISFILVVLVAGIVMAGVFGVRMYMAEIAYTIAAKSNNLDEAEINLKQALSLRGNSDVYNFYMARLYLLRAVELSKQNNPDGVAISSLMGNAVNMARRATDISPSSVGLWENLATMYENAAMLVPEARDWAIKSWIQATQLEPSNPILWARLGGNYLAVGKNEDAKKNFEEAIKLKNDLVVANVGLSQVYEAVQDFDKAVEAYKKIIGLSNNDPEIAFNYARLLYNRRASGDRDEAEKIWLKLVEQYPNHSNALYSLGMLYETRGNRYSALDYYYRVKELNPGNKDIEAKIKSMVGAPASVAEKKK